MEVLEATISCGDLSSHKLSIYVLAVQVAHDRPRYQGFEILGSGMVPLFDGAAQCKVRNASHVQGFEHHGYLLSTLDAIVLEINTSKKML